MKNHTTERTLGLSPAQVSGSALAAMSAALVASWAGTTGTIVGAAVGSVVATTGAATYTWWLRRTTEAVRRTAGQVRQVTITLPQARTVAQGPLRPGEHRPGGAVLTEVAETPDAMTTETAQPARARSSTWGRVLLASAAVTLAVLGGITSLEVLTGRTVSSMTGTGDARGTSLGDLVDGGESTSIPASTPEPAEPGQDVATTPSADTPSGEPASQPTDAPEPIPAPEDQAQDPTDGASVTPVVPDATEPTPAP